MSGKNCLTTHHDKFAFAHYLSCCSYNVMEILTSHPYWISSRIFRRSGSDRTPAKGEF